MYTKMPFNCETVHMQILTERTKYIKQTLPHILVYIGCARRRWLPKQYGGAPKSPEGCML